MRATKYRKANEGCSMNQRIRSSQAQDLINRLPDDCICDIFRLLDASEDLVSCSTVSWRWAELVLSLGSEVCETEENRHVVLEGHGLDDTQLVINVIGISRGDMVSMLDIIELSSGTAASSGVGHVTEKGVRFATKAFPNLSSVRLMGCLRITEKGILEISTGWTTFTSLYIEDCPTITVVSLQTLVRHAKRLSSLSLDSCPQISSSAIVSLMIEKPGLTSVELQRMYVVHQSVGSEVETAISLPMVPESQVIHPLHTLLLEDCSVGYVHGLLHQMFAHFELPLLKCLVIRGCSTVNHLHLIRLLGPDTTLERLDLATVRLSSYEGLMEVLHLCQETIQKLTLKNCTFGEASSPETADDIVPQDCPMMQMIKLDNCTQDIAQRFLSWLSKACPEVKEVSHVRMEHANVISSSLLDVMCRCKMITKMDLSRCWWGNNAAADSVISLLGDTLQELVLDGWAHFTGFLEEPLGRRCPNLVRLSLCDTAVNDPSLWFMMSKKLWHLEEILLVRTMVTDEALDCLLWRRRLPMIRNIDVRECLCVTPHAAVLQELFQRSNTDRWMERRLLASQE